MLNRTPVPVDNNGNTIIFIGGVETPYVGKGGDWGLVAGQILKFDPAADVDATYFVDPSTNIITVTIKATVYKDIASQTVFNAAIVENDVTPNSTDIKWKQVNKFYKNPDYTNHPWYDKPSPVSMTYQDVLRDYLGGHLGDASGVPATLKAGEKYTKIFSKVLPAGVKVENIKVITYLGFTSPQRNGNSVINVNYAVKTAPTVSITSTGASIFVTPTNGNTDKSWTCKNLTNGSVDFAVSVKMSDRTPADWKAVVEQATVTVNGGASANCKIIVTPGSTLGIGDAMVTITPTVGEPSSFKLTVVSKELDKVVLNYSATSDLTPVLETLDNYKGFVSLTSEETNAVLASLTSLKTVVANSSYDYSFDQMTSNNLAALYTSGKAKLFVHGALGIVLMGIQPTPVTNGLATTFGVTCPSTNYLKATTYNVTGLTGDPIGDGFKVANIGLRPNGVYPYFLSLGSGSKAVQFLSIDNTTGGIGFRVESNTGNRAVLLNQDLFAYNETQRATLTKKIMDWLNGVASETPVPIVTTSSTKLDFGNDKAVNVEHNQVLTISNTGTADLQIEKPEFTFGDADFKFTDGNTYPIILKKSASTTMRVSWTPKLSNKSYIESFTFATNDKNKPEITINLTGRTAATSVEDGTIGVFTAKLNNNPIFDNTAVNFTVGGSSEQNVNIKLIDASGAIVANLANANYMPGTYSVNLSTANLASGTYFVLANAAGVQAKLTAVVVK